MLRPLPLLLQLLSVGEVEALLLMLAALSLPWLLLQLCWLLWLLLTRAAATGLAFVSTAVLLKLAALPLLGVVVTAVVLVAVRRLRVRVPLAPSVLLPGVAAALAVLLPLQRAPCCFMYGVSMASRTQGVLPSLSSTAIPSLT